MPADPRVEAMTFRRRVFKVNNPEKATPLFKNNLSPHVKQPVMCIRGGIHHDRLVPGGRALNEKPQSCLIFT